VREWRVHYGFKRYAEERKNQYEDADPDDKTNHAYSISYRYESGFKYALGGATGIVAPEHGVFVPWN
jgi:hypothetical protein